MICTHTKMPTWTSNLHSFWGPIVKAFDTVNHTLLLSILFKYGIPPQLIMTIKKMYLNCIDLLKLGKETCETDYKSGVQQGDNMAPILFLYIMQAAIQSLQSRLTCNLTLNTSQYRRTTQKSNLVDFHSNQNLKP